MESLSIKDWWPKYEMVAKDENPFLFPNQFTPFDYFSVYGGDGYSPLDWPCELPLPDNNLLDAVPLMSCFPSDPLSSTTDINGTTQSIIQEDFCYGGGNGTINGVYNDLFVGFEPQQQQKQQPLLLCNNEEHGENVMRGERKLKRCRAEEKSNNSASKLLSRQVISQYFYMPITQAARELNVGLTLLKKRCRELGIRRWPHRKLMSLQTLIRNVQQLGKEESEESEPKLKDAIDLLERERKMMEELPDMQLEDNTKKLRQACFKANYKKRRLMGMMPMNSYLPSTMTTNTPPSNSTPCDEKNRDYEDDHDHDHGHDELQSFLSDSFSSSDHMLINF